MQQKKPWEWNIMEVGEEYQDEYVLTPELVKRYTDALGIEHPWYTTSSPWGGPIAPPSWIAQLHSRLMNVTYEPHSGAIHTRIDAKFFRPALVGKKVRQYGKLTDKYVKRGREYITYENWSVDEDGNEICRETREILIRFAKRDE